MKTPHSQSRQQQRGISDAMIACVMSYGVTRPLPGNAIGYWLPERIAKQRLDEIARELKRLTFHLAKEN